MKAYPAAAFWQLRGMAAKSDRPPRLHIDATTNSDASDTTSPPGCSRLMAKTAGLATADFASMGMIATNAETQLLKP